MGLIHDAMRRLSGPAAFRSIPSFSHKPEAHVPQPEPIGSSASPFAEALRGLGVIDQSGKLVSQDSYNWGLLGPLSPIWQHTQPQQGSKLEPIDALVKGQGANPYAGQGSDGRPNQEGPKGIFWDPYLASLQLGYRERPSWVNYGMCTLISSRVPIIPNLVMLRMRHIENFSKKVTHKFETGVRVRPLDPTVTLTAADKREIARIEEIVFPTPDPVTGIESFETIGTKMVKDSMIHDQVCIQVQRDRKGRPYRLYHMDASTIRLAALPTLGPQLGEGRPFAVQIKDGVVVETFTSDELLFHVCNPRTDIYGLGYGTPVIELLLSACTTFLNSWQYNQSQFTNGALTKGMINLQGERIPEDHLQDFREQFYTMLSGPANAFRVPIMNMQGQVQYVPFNGTNRDMEFSAWTDFLIKLLCFPGDTHIRMADGTTCPIKDVKVGQSVITHTGQAKKVIQKSCRPYKGRMTSVAAYGGRFTCTGEHPIYTLRGGNKFGGIRKFEAEREWKKAEELDVKRTLAEQDHVFAPTIKTERSPWIWQTTYVASNHRAIHVPQSFVVDQALAYWLGVYIAEGYTNCESGKITFGLNISEGWIAQKLFAIAKDKFGLEGTSYEHPEHHRLTIEFHNTELSRTLADTFGRGSRNLKLPIEAVNAPVEVLKALLAGMFEGDGTVSKNDFRYTTRSQLLCDQVQFCVWALTSPCSVQTCVRADGVETYDVLMGKRNLPAMALVTGPKRAKLDGLEALTDRTRAWALPDGFAFRVNEYSNFETDEEQYVCNLEVEDDHSYLVNSVAVHNCAGWSTDPIEIGFKYGNSSGKQMFEGASKSKIVESKERGLRPLLRMREVIYNRVIAEINPEFCLEHVGLEPITQKELADLDSMLVKTTMTINEIRKKNHMDPFPAELGDIVLDPNWLQNRANVMAKKEKEEAAKRAELISESHIAALIGADEASDLTPEDIQMIQGVLNGTASASLAPIESPSGDTAGGLGKGSSADIEPSGQGGGPGGGRVAPTLE